MTASHDGWVQEKIGIKQIGIGIVGVPTPLRSIVHEHKLHAKI